LGWPTIYEYVKETKMDKINKTIAQAYLSMYEAKKVERASWVPEAVADEDVADFMGAAAAAAKAGKKEFKFGDKTYKVTMKKSTADKIDDAVEVCPDCGKVHEGSCMKESPEEPRAKGEKDFKKMHDDNTEIVDEKDGKDETFDNIKKSADSIKK
jgi:hypothetical protein